MRTLETCATYDRIASDGGTVGNLQPPLSGPGVAQRGASGPCFSQLVESRDILLFKLRHEKTRPGKGGTG
jgi:hypothetical protein